MPKIEKRAPRGNGKGMWDATADHVREGKKKSIPGGTNKKIRHKIKSVQGQQKKPVTLDHLYFVLKDKPRPEATSYLHERFMSKSASKIMRDDLGFRHLGRGGWPIPEVTTQNVLDIERKSKKVREEAVRIKQRINTTAPMPTLTRKVLLTPAEKKKVALVRHKTGNYFQVVEGKLENIDDRIKRVKKINK